MDGYDTIFDWHIAARRPYIGVSDVAQFVRPLAPGSRVLDLGCGDGIPISQLLLRSGFELFALDSSSRMIERFRANFPDAPAQCARIQDSDFFNTSFDAVVAWGVFFFLAQADQEDAIAKVSKSLRTGGRFLFTSCRERVTWEDTNGGVRFPCTSLGSEEYSRLLQSNRLKLSDEHFDQWDNYYYIAEKVA
jgi:cyclopropane fatty-acyl-phospholipid synthase-like methyltransferase